IVLNDHRALPGWNGEGTEAEGYLLGLLIGDGTLKADKAVISVWLAEENDALLVANGAPAPSSGAHGILRAAEAAAATLSHRADFRGFQRTVARSGGACAERRMASGAVRALALRMGMRPGAKVITPAMERASSAFSVGLLRGLFDT
ncbi:ribonucleoside reductase, partial [Dysgonomonas mossii]